MDLEKYNEHIRGMNENFESICNNCGECCGALDDPCLNLARKENGIYHCKDYKDRLGPQQTFSGKPFTCVPIREHISKNTLRANCAYRNVC